jgi:hypothetical protein
MRRFAATIVIIAALAPGCSGKDPRAVLFGSGSKTASVEGVFYAAEDKLAVREGPASSARTIGYLELHEKVTRTDIENGYAHVRAAGSKLEGWVVNAKLDWRTPTKPAAATSDAPAAAATEPAAATAEPAAAATEPAAAPEAAAESAGEPAPEVTPEASPVAEPVLPDSNEAKPKAMSKPRDRSGAAVFDAY